MKLRRSPAARRFDRNCVLASTASQIVVALALGLEVAEIVTGESPFDVGTVAKDIRLAMPGADLGTAIVASAGAIGFCLAAGMPFEEITAGLQGQPLAAMTTADQLLQPWIDDGRLARLVAALDGFRLAGKRRFDG